MERFPELRSRGRHHGERSTILLGCTKEPNTLLVGYPVWLQLIQHPIILDRFKNHALPLGYPTDQQLAGLFNVDNFIVAKSLYDTTVKGLPTASTTSGARTPSWLTCLRRKAR